MAWITNQTFANLKPVNVFHKQLDNSFTYSHPENLYNQHILFRRAFNLSYSKAVKIMISADDYYKLYINGKFVSSGPAPCYPQTYYYNCIDITKYVNVGCNLIAVHTFYSGLINRVNVSGDLRHGLWLKLYNDGQLLLESDENFLCRQHSGYLPAKKIGYDTQFAEYYDANSQECGFQFSVFDDTKWEKACTKTFDDYKMVEQPSYQLQYYEVCPVSYAKKEDKFCIDFGQEMVGYLKFCIQGKQGSKVYIRYGEELDANGNVRYDMRCNCLYEDIMILSGKTDFFEPFDYKAFRYVELVLPIEAEIYADTIKFLVRHYPFNAKITYNGSNNLFKKIWILCENTLKYGTQEVFMDCPTREKGQYFQDGWMISLAYSYITNDCTLMRKMLYNQAQTSFICKGFMAQGPCSLMQEIAEASLLFPRILSDYYNLSGDMQTVIELFPYAEQMLEYFSTFEREDGLIGNLEKWCVVEWPDNYRDGYDFILPQGMIGKGFHNVANAYYLGALKARNYLAALCGKSQIDISNKEEAFIKAFYDTSRNLFKDCESSMHCSIHSNIFPLFFGIHETPLLKKNVINLIEQKRLSQCNIFGTFPMFVLLKRWQREDLIKDLLKDCNGFPKMLEEGATTTFEAWSKEKKWNTALFHLTFASLILFMTDYNFNNY